MSSESLEKKLKATIRDIPDFPKPGILFKDITTVLEDPALCREVIDSFAGQLKGQRTDAIVGIESRGFIFGMPLAQKLGIPFLIVRKQGKLPYRTIKFAYELEYGNAVMEMHENSVRKGWNVLVHDDLLATGGTAAAAAELVRMQGGQVSGFMFLVELGFLPGREKLEIYSGKISSLVKF